MLAAGDTAVLLGGRGPDGVAVLRFRLAIWSDALECYLAELYVAPRRRGRGLGRAMLQTAMEVARARGADHMDLGTSDSDVAARRLYESLGYQRWGIHPSYAQVEGRVVPGHYYYKRIDQPSP